MKKILRLGTRGSPLALVQAESVRKELMAAHTDAGSEIEIVPIRTSGDWRPTDKERTFLDTGGDKGLFVKEIEEALLGGIIDIAVHSMKDVPSQLPEGLEIAVLLARADPRDAFLSNKARTLGELPPGSIVGTSSLRRQAQILKHRPDLRVTPLRGNVETRLRKLFDGVADATILALAGLQRLGLESRVASIFDTETMLPDAGQGAIGLEIRRDDEELRLFLNPINHAPTSLSVMAERAFLRVLDGSCSTPIGALARIQKDGQLLLEGLVAKSDGTSVLRMSKSGDARTAESLGQMLGEDIKRQLPPDFFIRAA